MEATFSNCNISAQRLGRKMLGSLAALVFAIAPLALCALESPKLGSAAPDFTLKSLDGQTVKLSQLTAKGNVVLLVLRGWPGYQCPVCDVQVHNYIASQAGFAEIKAQMVFVYPGPAEDLTAHAEEFKSWKGKEWPKDFLYALDPDFSMVNAWGLRWNAPRQTAYPSTFIIDNKGTVRFAKVGENIGDRTKAVDMIAELKKLAK